MDWLYVYVEVSSYIRLVSFIDCAGQTGYNFSKHVLLFLFAP